MINTVRIWTRKPVRRFFVAIDREEGAREGKDAESKTGFFDDFLKQWEAQADLIVRKMQR